MPPVGIQLDLGSHLGIVLQFFSDTTWSASLSCNIAMVTQQIQRTCPRVKGNPCVSFMLIVGARERERDSHPTCVQCRGVTCDGTLMCDVCVNWSEEQWTEFDK